MARSKNRTGARAGRLLDWLASSELAACPIVHWGDYDPIGLAEYLRLKSRCGTRVTTYVPDNLEPLLKRLGKRKLITGQADILNCRRAQTSDPHISRMIALFDKHHKGLEQELLLRKS